MSGYGQGVAEGEGLQISFEVRSVNHRFSRVGLHLPAELGFFETTARRLIASRVERGKVDLTGTIRGPRGLPDVQINEELAASYAESLTALADGLGIEPNVDLAMLTSLPGVVSVSQVTPFCDPPRRVRVHLHYRLHSRRDPLNLFYDAKPVIDSLKQTPATRDRLKWKQGIWLMRGYFIDDDELVVGRVTQEVDRKHRGLTLTIEPLAEDG